MNKKLFYLFIKKRQMNYLIIQAVFLIALVLFQILKIFYNLGDTVKDFFVNDNSYLLFVFYAIFLTLYLAGSLYQDRFAGIFPGNAGTRLRAKLLCDHVFILEYAGVLAVSYLIMAACYYLLSKFYPVDIPGIFSISYLYTGVFYIFCLTLFFYALFSMLALLVRVFGKYVLITVAAVIVLVLLDFFVSNGYLYAELLTAFYAKILYYLVLLMQGVIKPLVVFVVAGSSWALSLAVQLLAVGRLRCWQGEERGHRWGYLIISCAMVGQLFWCQEFIFFEDAGYEGGYDYIVGHTAGTKSLFTGENKSRMAGRRVRFPDIGKEQRIYRIRSDDYNSFFDYYMDGYGGYETMRESMILSETEARDYGILTGEPLKENEIYVAYFFPNAVHHGDFILQSLADSINHSLTYNEEIDVLEISDLDRLTLVHNLYGNQLWKIAEPDSFYNIEDVGRYGVDNQVLQVVTVYVVRNKDVEKVRNCS